MLGLTELVSYPMPVPVPVPAPAVESYRFPTGTGGTAQYGIPGAACQFSTAHIDLNCSVLVTVSGHPSVTYSVEKSGSVVHSYVVIGCSRAKNSCNYSALFS